MNGRRAFSLAELILVMVLLGVFAAIAVPRLNLAVIGEQTADGAASRLAADLRYARQMAMAQAAKNPEGFGLFMEGTPPYRGYVIRSLCGSEVLHTYSIDETVDCRGGQAFRFGPLGNLLTGSDRRLTLSSGDRTCTLTLIPATGIVRCEEE